jgi:hypothetical protein
MTWLIVLATAILIFATSEVQVWSFTLNRHAWWMKKHPELEKRCINYKSLFYTSTFTALLSALTLFVWIYILVMGCMCPLSGIVIPALFFIGMGAKVVLISYLYLVAKLCRLNQYYYPPVTNWLIKKWIRWTES